MRTRTRPSNDWPAWRYGPAGESAIFSKEEDVPYGWVSTPGEVFIPKEPPETLDRAALIQELTDKGIQVQGQWSARYMKDLLK